MATATAPARLLPEVEKFLSESPLKSVIGGKDVASATGETMATRDPGTGEPIAEFAVLGAADVDRAVKAAADAFKKALKGDSGDDRTLPADGNTGDKVPKSEGSTTRQA